MAVCNHWHSLVAKLDAHPTHRSHLARRRTAAESESDEVEADAEAEQRLPVRNRLARELRAAAAAAPKCRWADHQQARKYRIETLFFTVQSSLLDTS